MAGSATRWLAIAFALTVLACDPDQRTPIAGVAWCELDELVGRADYLSLHLPLSEATRHLIGPGCRARAGGE